MRSLLSIVLVAGCSSSPAKLTADVVATFVPQQGQLPEGLARRDGKTYVGFAPGAAIVEVDAAGTTTPFATVPSTFGGSKGFTLGLAFDAAGQLYIAQASFDPSVVPGIYRVPAGGGAATAPWASDPAMTFPNGLAFTASGQLFVADSTGAVFAIDTAGHVAVWKRDPLLVGDPHACPGVLPMPPIGANGIVVTATDVWVTNTDHGALVRIPIRADGSAGDATAVVSDCALAGADGIALGHDGAFVAAINAKDELVRITQSGSFRTLVAGPPLDFPASVVIDGKSTFATAAAFVTAQAGHPALLEIH